MPSETLNAEAKAIFQKNVKGANVMTPYVRGYGVKGGFVYEFSEGKDMDGRPLYGITVVERESGHRRNDLSTCFGSVKEADEFLDTLDGGHR